MSHDFALILIPSEIKKDNLDKYVQDLFFPFDRNYEFPPLVYPCDCNELEESIQFANQNTRHFHQYWRAYNELPLKNRPLWKDYIKDWQYYLLAFRANNKTADPICDRCEGKGYFSSTYYPLNLYDYWHSLRAEYLSNISELVPEVKTHQVLKERTINVFSLSLPNQKQFSFYYVITPDGLPYKRGFSTSAEQWFEIWQKITKIWENSYVVRCLIHV